MTVRVVSKRSAGTKASAGETVVYVGRPHLLGNPYTMSSENQRNQVIDAYAEWLHLKLEEKGREYVVLQHLKERIRSGESIALQCWCAPKRCHADVIKEYLEAV